MGLMISRPHRETPSMIKRPNQTILMSKGTNRSIDDNLPIIHRHQPIHLLHQPRPRSSVNKRGDLPRKVQHNPRGRARIPRAQDLNLAVHPNPHSFTVHNMPVRSLSNNFSTCQEASPCPGCPSPLQSIKERIIREISP